MSIHFLNIEKVKNESDANLFTDLDTTIQGLSEEEAQKRLKEYGPNALEETKSNPLMQFLRFFWGPIPWMIEIAALLSLVLQHWADLAIILTLLVFNSVVGFWQEFQAGNAIEALKNKLATRTRVLRDGNWTGIEAKHLVPGDIIRLRLGDIIPADCKLLEGDYLSIDQAALTGESLPVNKKPGDIAYSGSIAKQGEMIALVTGTGGNTYFGRTAKLVETAQPVSHFQKAVLQIGDYLIYISLALVMVLFLVQIERGDSFIELLQFALILIVASIPVAMPAVLTVTMAVGALMMSKMKAIVSRLDSIEEMAGIDILCSDKTGTLTQNKLTLGDVVTFGGATPDDVILAGSLASKAEDEDPIDLAVIHGLPDASILKTYQQTKFLPFDPVGKRTEGTIVNADGNTFHTTKGAPQVILEMCNPSKDLKENVQKVVLNFAKKGFRTLGVARSDEAGVWIFLGLLPLFDPLREDSTETIHQAKEHGIAVKMVTGDNIAIAKEISGQLGLGQDIYIAESDLKGEDIEKAGGFAQVFPEHKYGIVKKLQGRDHIVGMTGDGVNDSPALKQADVGIAVSDATDAARAAASLVLTAPGLSVIITAIEEARRIFERMNSYAIYRIVETLRIMFFIVLAVLVYNFYPVTAVMIIMLALLNDLPIMTIAYDNTWLEPKPVRWNMRRVLTVATVLGIVGVFETFLLLIIAKTGMGISGEELQSIIFLKLVVAGHLTLFVARSKRAFWSKPWPSPILFTAVVATQTVAALIVGLGIFVTAIPWSYIGMIWLYCLAWMFVEDGVKLAVYRKMDR